MSVTSANIISPEVDLLNIKSDLVAKQSVIKMTFMNLFTPKAGDKHELLFNKSASDDLPKNISAILYDNEITSLIDIYFLRISFIPSDPLRYFIDITYSTDK